MVGLIGTLWPATVVPLHGLPGQFTTHMTFIDIPGASGSTYRFRAWPDREGHAPIAGIFVVLSPQGEVLLIGSSNDLSMIKATPLPSGALFTRLNVGRVLRSAEYADIRDAHPNAPVRED